MTSIEIAIAVVFIGIIIVYAVATRRRWREENAIMSEKKREETTSMFAGSDLEEPTTDSKREEKVERMEKILFITQILFVLACVALGVYFFWFAGKGH